MFIIYIAKIIHDFEMNLKFKRFYKKTCNYYFYSGATTNISPYYI